MDDHQNVKICSFTYFTACVSMLNSFTLLCVIQSHFKTHIVY